MAKDKSIIVFSFEKAETRANCSKVVSMLQAFFPSDFVIIFVNGGTMDCPEYRKFLLHHLQEQRVQAAVFTGGPDRIVPDDTTSSLSERYPQWKFFIDHLHYFNGEAGPPVRLLSICFGTQLFSILLGIPLCFRKEKTFDEETVLVDVEREKIIGTGFSNYHEYPLPIDETEVLYDRRFPNRMLVFSPADFLLCTMVHPERGSVDVQHYFCSFLAHSQDELVF